MESLVKKTNIILTTVLISFLILTVIITGAGYYYSFIVSKSVSRIETEEKILTEESQGKTDVIQKYNRIFDLSGAVFDSIPQAKEISSYIADIEAGANKNGIKINESIIGGGVKNKQTNSEFSQTNNQNDYYELQIKYGVEGSYLNFLNFLNDLSGLRRLNTISEMVISKNVNNPSGDLVNVNFTNTIYIKK